MKKCSNCRAENEDHLSFCTSCGTELNQVIFPKATGARTVSTGFEFNQVISPKPTGARTVNIGFELNTESIKLLWIVVIAISIIEIVIAFILSSGSEESISVIQSFSFIFGYVLCFICSLIVLQNAQPSGDSPWNASKKVGKILVIVGIIMLFIIMFISIPYIDIDLMNEAMAQGENYEFPPLTDLGGSFVLFPIFAWLFGGFFIIYGVVRFKLSKFS